MYLFASIRASVLSLLSRSMKTKACFSLSSIGSTIGTMCVSFPSMMTSLPGMNNMLLFGKAFCTCSRASAMAFSQCSSSCLSLLSTASSSDVFCWLPTHALRYLSSTSLIAFVSSSVVVRSSSSLMCMKALSFPSCTWMSSCEMSMVAMESLKSVS